MGRSVRFLSARWRELPSSRSYVVFKLIIPRSPVRRKPFLQIPRSSSRFRDYLSYYRRKSCILLLSNLSIFDASPGNMSQIWKLYPILFAAVFPGSPAFLAFSRRFLQKSPLLFLIYIKFFINSFYEELSTLSTELSTGQFPKIFGFSLPFSRLLEIPSGLSGNCLRWI